MPYPIYEQASAELNHQIAIAGKNEKGWHIETKYHYRKEKKDMFEAI